MAWKHADGYVVIAPEIILSSPGTGVTFPSRLTILLVILTFITNSGLCERVARQTSQSTDLPPECQPVGSKVDCG